MTSLVTSSEIPTNTNWVYAILTIQYSRIMIKHDYIRKRNWRPAQKWNGGAVPPVAFPTDPAHVSLPLTTTSVASRLSHPLLTVERRQTSKCLWRPPASVTTIELWSCSRVHSRDGQKSWRWSWKLGREIVQVISQTCFGWWRALRRYNTGCQPHLNAPCKWLVFRRTAN